MQPIPSYNKTNPISTYFAVKNNPVAFLTSLSQEGHPIIKFSILGFSYYLVNEPELVQEALVKNPEALIIKGGASAALARLIGHGILTNRGSNWRKSRTSLQPLFSQKAMEAAVPDTLTCIQESFEHWQSKYMDRAFCLNRELLALSFRIKAVTLFKYDPSLEEAEHFADAVWTLQTEGVKRYMTGIDYLPWLPLKINKKVNAAITELFTLAKSICKTNPDYPADEITSLLFAGAESPANTLVWVMHMLKENPKWLDYLKQPQNIPDSLSEAESFDARSQVISETMRLYPAGWAFERYATEQVTLTKYIIKRGSRLLFSPYLLHRNPTYWQDPSGFNPLRFSKTPLSADSVPKYAYLPFGAGPRSCIGYRLSMLEMKLFLSILISKCDWHFLKPPEVKAIKPWGSFKLKFQSPVFVKMKF